MNAPPHRISVAPMMDWTDRHCRFFHRQLTRRALLHTEMITADAVIHGDRDHLLGLDEAEHPVAVQLGGSEPEKIALAAAIAAGYGYDEINLNIGCPSDRVQSGRFGACLMREPALVAELVAAAKVAVRMPVTVKCRLGVDEQDPDVALGALAEAVIAAGADAIWVHARKAWLHGLSPKENREVPPLDYARVVALKRAYPDTFIGINGGVSTLDQADALLAEVDGVMLGRAAYHSPATLADIDARFYGDGTSSPDLTDVVQSMVDYIDGQVAAGARLAAITRHMLGLFQGVPGARRWRQILTVEAIGPGARADVVGHALAAVQAGATPARRLAHADRRAAEAEPAAALA